MTCLAEAAAAEEAAAAVVAVAAVAGEGVRVVDEAEGEERQTSSVSRGADLQKLTIIYMEGLSAI